MSTSDPDRPADDTTPAPAEDSTPPQSAAPEPTPAPTVEPVAAAEPPEPATPAAPSADPVVAPTAAEPVATPVVAEPVATPVVAEPVATPVVAEPVATPVAEPAAPPVAAEPAAPPVAGPVAEPAKPEPVSLDTGRHAIVRPVPVPPDDPAPAVATPAVPPAAVVPVDTAAEATVDPALAAAAAASVTRGTPSEPGPYGAITPEPDVDGRLFPDPNAPSSPSAGSRILGVLVGLILTPIAVGVLLLGESQILEAQVDGWDATTSVFGIVLVSLGLLLLGCVLLLGIWTSAVPITGGALLTAVGAVYLYAPSIAREQTLTFLTSSGWRKTITQVTVAGTSGMVIAVGFLLLLAGLVIASARKRGVHLGEFRERHKV